SASLVSGAGEDPRRATVWLCRDDANGFVIGSITARAEDTLVRQIDAAAQESYFRAVFGNLHTIRGELGEAADGAGQLQRGLAEARTGAHELADGAGTAEDGANELARGTEQAKRSGAALSSGLHALADAYGPVAGEARKVAVGRRR